MARKRRCPMAVCRRVFRAMAAWRSHSRVAAMTLRRLSLSCLLVAVACSSPAPMHVEHGPPGGTAKKGARTITIIGTNDLHGAIDRLPLLAGFVANIRAVRQAD